MGVRTCWDSRRDNINQNTYFLDIIYVNSNECGKGMNITRGGVDLRGILERGGRIIKLFTHGDIEGSY